MAGDNRGSSSLFRRDEQLTRWKNSETNKQKVIDRSDRQKVRFSDGCIFLAAGAAGDKDELKRLLDRGADINSVNQDGITALHAACIDNNLEIVEFLVDNNADINRCDMEGWTPLHATASCGSLSMAEFLISRGADLSVVNNDGELAIDVVEEDDMARLLQDEMDRRGIDCDASRSREERHMLDDAQSWLNNKQVLDQPHSKTGATALHVAAAKGYIKVMRLLLDGGVDINAKDFDGWTSLHAAAHWGQTEAVEILCDNMADMDLLNCVGQTAYDLGDDTMKPLMDELRRKQEANKLIYQNKMMSKKRKPSPHKEKSNKKEKESSRGDSTGTSSSDESSILTVDKRTTSPSVDQSEVQSWRRPSLRNKTINDHRNSRDETSRVNASSLQVNHKEDEVVLRKNSTSAKEEKVNCLATEHREKALSCIALSPSCPGGTGDKISTIMDQPSSPPLYSSISMQQSPLRRTTSLSTFILSSPVRRNIRLSEGSFPIFYSSYQSSSSQPTVTSSFNPNSTTNSVVSSSLCVACPSNTSSVTTSTSSFNLTLRRASSLSDNLHLNKNNVLKKIFPDRNSSFEFSIPYASKGTMCYASSMSAIVTTTASLSCIPKFSHSMSTPSSSSVFMNNVSLCTNYLSSSNAPLNPHELPLIAPATPRLESSAQNVASNEVAHNVAATNIINKNPEVLARSQSLKARIQRNCQDILKLQVRIQENSNVTSSQTSNINSSLSTSPTKLMSSSIHATANGGLPAPPKTVPSIIVSQNNENSLSTAPVADSTPTNSISSQVAKMTAGSVIKNFFKSFVPPSRDDESETQRKAHAKMVRSTRRSTQGITLEDVKSAEQFMKTKTGTTSVESPEIDSSQLSSSGTVDTSSNSSNQINNAASNKDSSVLSSNLEARKTNSLARTPSWRLKVKSDKDAVVFSLDSSRTKDKTSENEATDAVSVSLPNRKKSLSEDTKKLEDKSEDKTSSTREGTQAVIQRKKKPKRRSTGVVNVAMDDIDPDRKKEEIKDNDVDELSSVGDRESLKSRSVSRTSSTIGAPNGDIDYKKLYEEQLSENDKLMDRLKVHERELRQAKDSIDTHTKAANSRQLLAESERREKRALERKLSEMEEELRELDILRQENQRLKDENGALIRVISKLSR